MSDIKRINVGKRMSDIAIFNRVAYLVGVTPEDPTQDIEGQTKQVLARIDRILAEAGTDKSRLLTAQIFLTHISEFEGMNRAWDAWIPQGATPARATIEARLAKPEFKVEIMVTAALPDSQ